MYKLSMVMDLPGKVGVALVGGLEDDLVKY
jgi:hypothetical protein